MPAEYHKDRATDPFGLIGAILKSTYKLEGVAGSGTMGVVYRARNLNTGKDCAVKVLPPDLLICPEQSATLRKLFDRGAAAARKLKHPNIVSTYDSGIEGNRAFVVMEWLEGHTLDDELTLNGPLSLDLTVAVLDQVCGGLNRAHRKKVIHLDLKPSNVFVLDPHTSHEQSDKRVIKLIDFGLARVMRSTNGTNLSRTVGTGLYTAPEVFARQASPLSDIYSLGVTTFEMLTGKRPFKQSQIDAMVYKQVELTAPPAREIKSEIPESVDKLLRRTINEHQEARPQTAQEFFGEFQSAVRANKEPSNNKRSSGHLSFVFHRIRR